MTPSEHDSSCKCPPCYYRDDEPFTGALTAGRPLSMGERGLCNGVKSCQHGIAWNNGCPQCAAEIVTSLCDEYGIEPHEMVDFVQRDHSIVMAFDELVRERERDLLAAGNEMATAISDAIGSLSEVRWARVRDSLSEWRKAR